MSKRPADYGGFIGLEALEGRPKTGLPHSEAVLLTSGRACMGIVLDHHRPKRLLVPFFTCNSLIEPARQRGVEIVFLPIDEQLKFIAIPDPAQDDLVVLIDHFGVRSGYHMDLARSIGDNVVLDLTHSFYTKPEKGQWGFNSCRKFFGVPDGGFLFSPIQLPIPEATNRSVHTDHLVLRAISSGDHVMQAFRENEARMTSQGMRASIVTQDLLRHVDHEGAREARLENFKAVHNVLGDRNILHLIDNQITGPLCYPFLGEMKMDLRAFHAKGIFAARYWPDLDGRTEKDLFITEIGLSERLLAIPIDQRYSTEDVTQIAWEIHHMI